MRLALRVIAFLALVIIVSFAVAQTWWNQWMYHGWSAPPGFIHAVFGPYDGEASYNATLNEMWIISALAFGLLVVIIKIVRKRLITKDDSALHT